MSDHGAVGELDDYLTDLCENNRVGQCDVGFVLWHVSQYAGKSRHSRSVEKYAQR